MRIGQVALLIGDLQVASCSPLGVLLLLGAANAPLALYGYTDVDWAGSIADRRSTSGFMFSFGSAAVTWSSKKQPTVALLSLGGSLYVNPPYHVRSWPI